MAAGLPVVAFDHPAEAAIIEHGVSGFLSKSDDEFYCYVEMLLCNDDLYRSISSGAVNAVRNRFDYRRIATKLMNVIEDAASRPVCTVSRQISSNNFDYGLATFALNSFFDHTFVQRAIDGPENAVELIFNKIREAIDSGARGAWVSETKSSPFHYLTYFPASPGLNKLCGLIREYASCPS
jgi:hypothetical protein